MIYLGNGMYSDSGPNNQLMHYGVLGMRWGVRRAQDVANSMELYRKRGTQASLKEMYRSGKISKEQYKAAKKKNKLAYKLGKWKNKQDAETLSSALRNNIKAGKTKGIKARSIRDAAIASANKAMPGSGDLYKAGEKQRKARILFGTIGSAATAGSYTNAYKNMYDNNKSMFNKEASKYSGAQKPTSTKLTGKEESDAWKALAEYYSKQQKKK